MFSRLKTANSLTGLGEVQLSGRMDTATEEQHSDVLATLSDIHAYRDMALSGNTGRRVTGFVVSVITFSALLNIPRFLEMQLVNIYLLHSLL